MAECFGQLMQLEIVFHWISFNILSTTEVLSDMLERKTVDLAIAIDF